MGGRAASKAVQRKVSQSVTLRLLALGWVLLLTFALRVAVSGGIAPEVGAFQVSYLIGFAGYLLLIVVISRSGSQTRIGQWRWWFAGCVAIRLLLAATEPGDDAYRYVWEGRVQLAGYSPYVHAPDDPLLASLGDESWSRINHPHFPAIYPPLAQIEFLAIALVYPSVYTAKLFHVAWDVLVVAVLASSLRRRRQRPHWAVVYALCPPVIAAFAVEGHLDSLMLVCIAVTVWAVTAGRANLAGIMLGLAIAAKTVPVVLLPWFAWRYRRAAVIAVATVVLCYAPYVYGGGAGLTNLWRFAGSGALLSPLALIPVPAFDTPGVRSVLAGVLVLTSLILAWRRRDFVRYGAEMTAALVILLPIVHYWYLTWVLLYQPFRLRVRWLVVALLMVVYFEARRREILTGDWIMPWWGPAAVWGPFLAAWLLENRAGGEVNRRPQPEHRRESAS